MSPDGRRNERTGKAFQAQLAGVVRVDQGAGHCERSVGNGDAGMSDSDRFFVAKASGSRFAYVIDTFGERKPKRFDVLTTDGWTAADKLCARFNTEWANATPVPIKEQTP